MREMPIYHPEKLGKDDPVRRIKVDKNGVLLTPEEMREQRKNPDQGEQN